MEQTKGATDNHDTESEIDHCSPFCTCSCCGTPVLSQLSLLQFTCVKFSPHTYSEYFPSFTTSFSAAIWQPPQLI
jgi:hypothetical protein